MNNIKKIIFVLLITILMSGCWDKVEIENRAFISAVGIDVFKEKNGQSNEDKVDEPKKSKRNKYTITYVFPNLNAIGKNATGDQPRFVLSSVGRNPYETTRELSTRIDKTIFFKHMKVFIFGEEVAKNPKSLRENIDALQRHDEISKKINVMISKGEAKEVIEVENQLEPVTGTFLSQLAENKESTARFNSKTLQDILISLKATGSALIPRVIPGDKGIKMGGSAIIKNYKLIGWLGELENRSVMFMKNKVMSDIVDATYKDIVIPYIITESSTEKTVSLNKGNPKVDISISMEGYLQEYILEAEESIMDKKVISAIEKEVEKTVENQINGTVEKLQKQFKVDIIGINEYLSKFKPNYWEEVKDNWEDVFANIDINVKVDAKLRRVGMTE